MSWFSRKSECRHSYTYVGKEYEHFSSGSSVSCGIVYKVVCTTCGDVRTSNNERDAIKLMRG